MDVAKAREPRPRIDLFRNGCWWCNYAAGGVRRRESCKTKNRKEALAFLVFRHLGADALPDAMIDLPIVSQVVEAGEEKPFLALALRLEIPVVRGLLGREELHMEDVPVDTPAMATGEVLAVGWSIC